MFLIWQIGYLRRRQSRNTRSGNEIIFCETDDNNLNNLVEVRRRLESEMDAMASTCTTNRDEHLLTLNVKYRHVFSTITISTDLTVADLKSTALKKLQLLSDDSPELYRLIYCGSPLNEKLSLLDSNLTNESNLHVIRIDQKGTLRSSSVGNTNLTPSDYFIYCPVCKTIQASKLRIKCSGCSDLNSFLIDQNNMRCREDVFSHLTVPGSCSNSGCKSTQAMFIFQCRQTHQYGNSVPLKHIRNNARHVLCVTCVDDVTPVIVFPCESQHTMCLNCFKIYGIICLNERRFQQTEKHGYSLLCPAGCLHSHIQEPHHFYILGPEEYERYKNFATEEYVIKNGGVLCPNPKCGQGMIPETNANTICCLNCQYEFCRLCSCDSHPGACGRQQQPVESSELSTLPSSEILKKCQWENESLSLISQISKACPKCNVKTEKNGGCNHMYCSRCDGEWCWICVKTWTSTCMEDHWLD